MFSQQESRNININFNDLQKYSDNIKICFPAVWQECKLWQTKHFREAAGAPSREASLNQSDVLLLFVLHVGDVTLALLLVQIKKLLLAAHR